MLDEGQLLSISTENKNKLKWAEMSCWGLGNPKDALRRRRCLAWKIPWMEKPGRLQSMGSQRVGHDWGIHFHFSFSCIGEGNGNPLQYSCLENPRDGGTWWAAIYGVAQSRTRLKRLSSSSSIVYLLWVFVLWLPSDLYIITYKVYFKLITT